MTTGMSSVGPSTSLYNFFLKRRLMICFAFVAGCGGFYPESVSFISWIIYGRLCGRFGLFE